MSGFGQKLMTPPLSIRSRSAQLEALGNHIFDVLVLGAGITGVATAHELTRRGYRTAIIDSHDFASGTSQESSQLIWGGIKYLEQGHFRLVSGLCSARNEWVQEYPERVARQPFLYPRYEHDRHALPILMAGAYVYWLMGGGAGWPPLYRPVGSVERAAPQLRVDSVTGGMEYTDARMVHSDARLVLDLLFDAVDAGLTAVNYVEMDEARRSGRHAEFEFQATDRIGGRKLGIRAHWVINTTGVWVDEVNRRLEVEPPHELLFSKGIHLVLPRIETRDKALTCVAKDGRVFFVIPWGEATLVGTTDTPHREPPCRVRANAEDINYLRAECEAKFRMKVEDADILNTKAGLRPLVKPKHLNKKDFLDLSREHKVWSDPDARTSALWGGKYTDAFPMARELADTVMRAPSQESGQIPLQAGLQPPESTAWREGAVTGDLLAEACSREFVVRLEDLLRRRTNIGLKVTKGGWGRNDEHAASMGILAEAVSQTTGRPPDSLLEEYRSDARTPST